MKKCLTVKTKRVIGLAIVNLSPGFLPRLFGELKLLVARSKALAIVWVWAVWPVGCLRTLSLFLRSLT